MELLLSHCFSSTYIIHFTCNIMLLQACDSEDDGLISFDVHSDGEGGRYVFPHTQPPPHPQTRQQTGFVFLSLMKIMDL